MSSRQEPSSEMTSPETVVGAFRLGKEIGRGSFAAVYQGVHSQTKALVAIKSVLRSKLNRKLLDNLECEIQILKSIDHPHIVALLDCQKSHTYIHLVMEYCSLGDLQLFIRKRDRLHTLPDLVAMSQKYPSTGGGLNEVIIRHFLQQLASALEFLRARNLIHRDIKPQNLLLQPPAVTYGELGPYSEGFLVDKRKIPEVGLPDLPILKIADFGFARNLPSTTLADTLCGSPLYMAPEILRYEKYDAKADLWSLGTVLYEMIVGKPPFRAKNHVDLIRKIEKNDDFIKFPEDIAVSEELQVLARRLLKKGPVERVSFNDFFHDPVVKGPIPGAIYPTIQGGIDLTPVELRQKGHDREVARPGSVEPNVAEYFPPRASHQTAGPSRQAQAAGYGDAEDGHRTSAFTVARAHTFSQVPRTPVREQEMTRPHIQHLASAPVRQDVGRHGGVSTGVPMERQLSQQTASPGSSFLVQRQTQQQRQASREKEAKDKEQDNLEQEYVVIEKRTVEVNALADEVAAAPQITGRSPSSMPKGNALARRVTTGQSTPSRAIVGKRPDSYREPRNSFERKFGTSPGSAATSALARALAMVNTRLSNVGLLPPSVFGNYNPVLQSPQYVASGMYQPGSVVVVGAQNANNGTGLSEDDFQAVQSIEEAANRSDVVYQFAEVKFSQLLPTSLPSPTANIGLLPPSASERVVIEGSDLPADAIVALAEEALVLYVKTLSLLARAMDIAGRWWAARNQDPNFQVPNPTANASAISRMNNAVQWVRERFNEVLEKAEYVRRKLVQAQKELPRTHASHPSNHPKTSSPALGVSVEGVVLSPGVSAEKLMYDRALEMSRTAAVNEMVGDSYGECEIAYVTAIWMLEGVLEPDDNGRNALGVDHPAGDGLSNMEEDDRKVIEKFILGIRGRLGALRKKMATISRRSSGGMPSGTPTIPLSPPHSPKPLST
ncbi:Serine/threonine-protein kinase [Drechslerella dactyloides]|uniref:non-specific serine/threonine protein kinase n=1 Tax=Drechslerella dactyloides TaxID=74499 RepID=A0AAD6J295_DREDA|nr:Serine/threonine-protein kinase [Drechslerella dactyloides]